MKTKSAFSRENEEFIIKKLCPYRMAKRSSLNRKEMKTERSLELETGKEKQKM